MNSENPDPTTYFHARRLRRLLAVTVVTILAATGIYAWTLHVFESRLSATPAKDPTVNTEDVDQVDLSSEITSAAVIEASGVWPNLFGPTHDSQTQETVNTEWNAAGPPIFWEIAVGEGYSSPIVWKDRVIVMHRIGDEEIVACVNASDGRPIWERRTLTSFRCQSHYTNGPYSTPATDGEFVFTISAEGLLQCLKLASGTVVWDRDLKTEYHLPDRIFGVGHSPLIWDEKLIVNVGGTVGENGIVAFSKSNGEILWSATNHAASYATPHPARIHDQDFLFVLTDQGIVSLDPSNGKMHWEIPFEAPIVDAENAVTPLVYGDIALFCSYGNGTKCLQILQDGSYELLWESKRALTSQFSPLICVDEYLYGVHTGDMTLRCIELTTGEVMWREKTELKRATALKVGNRLILFGEYGHLASMDLNPVECQLVCQTESSLFDNTHCFSAPALANGKLYLRNERKLVCFDLAN